MPVTVNSEIARQKGVNRVFWVVTPSLLDQNLELRCSLYEAFATLEEFVAAQSSSPLSVREHLINPVLLPSYETSFIFSGWEHDFVFVFSVVPLSSCPSSFPANPSYKDKRKCVPPPRKLLT